MTKVRESRILVLRSGAVGDCIVCTPALAALRERFPDAHITLLGDPFSADIFRNSPDVDRVIALDSKQMSKMAYAKELLKLRLEKFSLIIDMHGIGRSFVQTLAIGAPQKIGFDIRSSHRFAYTDVVPYQPDVHAVIRQARILEPIGVPVESVQGTLKMILNEEDRMEASQLLDEAGLRPLERYVVLHATAGSGRDLKQWLPERWASLIDIIQRETGFRVVLTGQGPEEVSTVEAIVAHAQTPVLSLFGKTRLRPLAAVLENAEMYLGCDTGPMHIAAALSRPVVALFGPADPVRWRPWSLAPYRLVRLGLDCSPCSGKSCPFDVRCMRDIQVDQVWSAVREVLSPAAASFPGIERQVSLV